MSFDPISNADLKKLRRAVADLHQAVADVQQVASGSVIKSVQRGVITADIGNQGTEVFVTVNPVDLSKSVLTNLGGVGGTESRRLSLPVLSLVDESTISVRWSGIGYTLTYASCSFQLVEYY